MNQPTLLVDDALTVVHATRQLLEQRGQDPDQILTAYSAEEAMRLFEEHHPGAVLLDVDLPDMGGHELAKDLREADPETEIVLCTGLSEEDSRVRSAVEQMHLDVIEKPVDGRDLDGLGLWGENGAQDGPA